MPFFRMVLIAFTSFALVASCLEDDDYPRDVIANVLKAARTKRGIVDDNAEV